MVPQDVFRGSDAVRSGAVSRAQLQGRRFRRLFQDVYVDARVLVDHAVLCRGALLVLPDGSCIVGRSAAWLWGARSAVTRGAPVEVAVPAEGVMRARAGMRIRRVLLGPGDVGVRWGLPTTTAVRTAWDVAAREAQDVSVPVIDEMAHARLVDTGSLLAYAESRARCRGSLPAGAALALVDGRAESPPESRLRLALVRAGLHPVPQVAVRDTMGRVVARVDLAFPDERVAIEYDGSHHAKPGQFTRDRERLNDLQEAGWEVILVTAADLADLDAVVDRVRRALHRRRTP